MIEMAPRPDRDAVTIKKYANRRLYNTATSAYVTLDNLCQMVKDGVEFNVYDAKSGDDITRSVLTQIIVEEESEGGQNLLPIGFLRQLIGFYGGNLQGVLPKYLEQSMAMFSQNQERFAHMMHSAFGNVFPFNQLEEMGKQNMALFDRAMKMFSASFGAGNPLGGGNVHPLTPVPTPAPTKAEQIEDLQDQLNALQTKLRDLVQK